jgi:hypothetical protein
MRPSDIIFVQCLDNTVYMACSEEGGDLHISKYPDGEYHVEGDLILVAKDWQFMVFKILLPILRLLEGMKVIFVTLMPLFLEVWCCDELENAPNRFNTDFEKKMCNTLAEYRRNFKDFLFTNVLRGFTVIDPSLTVPANSADYDLVWGDNPVHPTTEGYKRVVDLFMTTMEKLGTPKGGTKRPVKDGAGSKAKKARQEAPRPWWISEGTSCKQQITTSSWRGRGSGRGFYNYRRLFWGGRIYGRGGGRSQIIILYEPCIW